MITKIPGLIAYCDGADCLRSAEDSDVVNPKDFELSLTTTGEDHWKRVDEELLCFQCWKEREKLYSKE